MRPGPPRDSRFRWRSDCQTIVGDKDRGALVAAPSGTGRLMQASEKVTDDHQRRVPPAVTDPSPQAGAVRAAGGVSGRADDGESATTAIFRPTAAPPARHQAST